MEIKLLGPLHVTADGHSIEPTANKPRQLVSLLAVRPGQLVTTQEMIEELWGTKVCRTALQCLQTYVMRLRQALELARPPGGRMAKDVLVTRPCGYTLEIPAESVDVHHYQELVAAGEAAMEAADYENASSLLGSALRWWQGPALIDVRTGPRLDIEVARLEHSRLSTLETRIDADLRLGRHRQLLGELTVLTLRYPMHEKLCAQYMTALSMSGRKSHALEVFRTLRQKLVDDLGVEPSGDVQWLQRAILNSGLRGELAGPAQRGHVAAWTPGPVPTYQEHASSSSRR